MGTGVCQDHCRNSLSVCGPRIEGPMLDPNTFDPISWDPSQTFPTFWKFPYVIVDISLTKGPLRRSCSLVWSLIRNPRPLTFWGNIDCSSYMLQ